MGRLIRLEFLKLRHNRAVWILLALYLVCVIAISLSGGVILKVLAGMGIAYRGIDPTVIPIYDFDDIWQNLAYLGYFFKIFPAFLLIISITNEFSYKTHRQNIIDGLSRREFFLSKLSFAGFLAVLSALLLLILGLILGFLNSSVTSWEAITSNIFFIPLHAFQIMLFFLFAMFLALLIRRSGITVVLLLMYAWFLEPIAAGITGYYVPVLEGLFPLEAIGSLVHFPFSKYVFMYTQDFVSLGDAAWALGWCGILLFGIYYQLARRDF